MSLDRNANEPVRLRRNAQRERAGGGTASIKVVAPVVVGANGIGISLSSTGALVVASNKLAAQVDGTTVQIVSNKISLGSLAFTPLPLGKSGGSIGFFGATPATQPTVTGSKGANAALGSLLTGLAALGLIVDTST